MICTKCGKNEATVYYRQEINGEVTEKALCSKCAEEIGGVNIGHHSGMSLFDSLFAPQLGRSARVRSGSAKTCPLCGARYGDFARSGKAGCAVCYDTFRGELAGSIERIHGRVKHIGRAPSGHAEVKQKQNRIAELKKQMGEAIERQDFEAAAKYRDEIRTLEDGGTQHRA